MNYVLSYLLLGTNQGDKISNLENVKKEINNIAGKISKFSSVYITEPWGFEHPEEFLNQAICIKTSLNPEQLLDVLLNIELKMGRVRNRNEYQARIIDIDILLYNNLMINTERLIIPHPLLHERLFALKPLTEIAPGYEHPVLKKTITELLKSCKDTKKVKKI